MPPSTLEHISLAPQPPFSVAHGFEEPIGVHVTTPLLFEHTSSDGQPPLSVEQGSVAYVQYPPSAAYVPPSQ